MRRVIIESPFAGDIERNILYARRAVRDCLARGEAPICSHLLFTQDGILKDDIPEERRLGIDAGLAWYDVAAASVVYADYGVSKGMQGGIAHAHDKSVPVEFRTIGKNEDKPPV